MSVPVPGVKPHLSPSQMAMFDKCPEQWRRVHLEGHRSPPGIAAIRGRGVHAGAEVNYRQKIESHADMPEGDVVGAAVAAYESDIVKGEFVLTNDEVSRGSGRVIGEYKDATARLAGLYRQAVAPQYQPVMVEQKVMVPLNGADRDLLCVIDLADDKDRIADMKTAGRAKRQDEVEHSTQLTFQAAAFRVQTGRDPSDVRLNVLVDTKKPYTQTLVSTRGEADYQVLLNRVNTMLAVIKAGAFPPAPVGAWWCAKKFCGFAADGSCPYFNSEREVASMEV